MLLLDTCALLWWTLDPEKLSAKAAQACETLDRTGGAASAISLWEIGIKIKRGKLDIGISIDEYADRVRRIGFLEMMPVDDRIWVETVNLAWDHRDPVDRVIVATARLRKLPLVTPDTEMRAFYGRTVW